MITNLTESKSVFIYVNQNKRIPPMEKNDRFLDGLQHLWRCSKCFFTISILIRKIEI